jgi:hypothetical protein
MKSADQISFGCAGITSGTLMRAGNRRLPRRRMLSRRALYTRYSRHLPRPGARSAGYSLSNPCRGLSCT